MFNINEVNVSFRFLLKIILGLIRHSWKHTIVTSICTFCGIDLYASLVIKFFHSVSFTFRCCTVSSNIIRALATILMSFLYFDWLFLSSHTYYKLYKAYRTWLDKYLFHKSALGMRSLTRIISSARIILLPTVQSAAKLFEQLR